MAKKRILINYAVDSKNRKKVKLSMSIVEAKALHNLLCDSIDMSGGQNISYNDIQKRMKLLLEEVKQPKKKKELSIVSEFYSGGFGSFR